MIKIYQKENEANDGQVGVGDIRIFASCIYLVVRCEDQCFYVLTNYTRSRNMGDLVLLRWSSEFKLNCDKLVYKLQKNH